MFSFIFWQYSMAPHSNSVRTIRSRWVVLRFIFLHIWSRVRSYPLPSENISRNFSRKESLYPYLYHLSDHL